MGMIGFLFGLIIGWFGIAPPLLGLVTIKLCLFKILFFCLIGPHIIIGIIVGLILMKLIPF
jgi:hypothetical protein